jgi:hypothetical protein
MGEGEGSAEEGCLVSRCHYENADFERSNGPWMCSEADRGMKKKINILMVDDQPAKLLSYEVMLGDLDEIPILHRDRRKRK